MHYYKKNIGDYSKKAGRLSMLQHGAYTLLIDSCYDRERFPTKEEAIEWTWASTAEEVEAVEFVLSRFFTLEDGVYIQTRIKEEIDAYHQKAATNKRIAIEREAKRKENNTKREQGVNDTTPNHKPLTNNQEPLDIKPDVSNRLPPVPYQKILDLYHKKTTLPRVAVLSEKRKRSIKARWKEELLSDLEAWENYFNYVASTPFLNGSNDRGWTADFDFLIKPETPIKCQEGKYTNEVR